MQEQVNLDEITDIKELKVLKADNYDALELANQQVQVAQQNISLINQRISKLTGEEREKAKK